MTGVQWFLMLIAGLLILWWLFRNKTEEKEPYQEGTRIVGTYEGYMVTWMKNFHIYENVRGESAMRIVYGRADIYDDGFVESIPESHRMTYHMSPTDLYVRFNPMFDMHLLGEYQRKQGGKQVVFADGTEQYLQANLMGVRNSPKRSADTGASRVPRSNTV